MNKSRTALLLFVSFCVSATMLSTDVVLGQLPVNVVAHVGDSAAGAGGAEHSFFSGLVISDDGSIVLSGGLTGTGVTSDNNHGIWGALEGESLGLIGRRGDVAPDSEDRTWINFFSNLSVGNNGRYSFRNQVLREGFTTTGDVGIWSGELGGTNSAVAIQLYDDASSTINERFRSLNFGSSPINSSGQVIFSGEADIEGGGSSSIRDVLWIGDPGGANPLIRVATATNSSGTGGDAAPNSQLPSSDWSFFGGTDLNDAGQVTFLAGTRSTGTDGFAGQSIWSGDPTDLKLIAKVGDVATGANGDTWTRLQGDGTANHPVINQNGTIAFNGRVEDSGGVERRGVWAGAQNSLRLQAISGQSAPGTDNLTMSGAGGQVGLNNSDQVMFTASLDGSGINAGNNGAIYATDAFGQLFLAVREGDDISINDQQFRLSAFVVDQNGGGIAGDAKLGTARLAFSGSYFDPTQGNRQAAMTMDINDVHVDTLRSSNSLVLNDSTRNYSTAGNLNVATAGTGDVSFEIRSDPAAPNAQIVVSANNAVFGSDIANGNGLITDGNQLLLSGNLTIAEDSSLVVSSESELGIAGDRIINHGLLQVGDESILNLEASSGSPTDIAGTGFYDLSLIADETITLSPGSSEGSMSIRDLTMASGGQFNWEVASQSAGGTAGIDWDLLEITDLSIDATSADPFLINLISESLTDADFTTSQSWLIATIDEDLFGFDSSKFEFDLSGLSASLMPSKFSIELVDIGEGNQGLNINFNSIPEPTFMGLGLLGVVVCGLTRRRRTSRVTRESC